MVFRARLTRATRGILCAAIAVFLAWAIHKEIVFFGVDPVLRAVALVPTSILELALVVGLWRLWVVCLIVNDDGVIVRNFRGDIRYKRSEIRGFVPVMDFAGCHVAIRLKTGDELGLDGIAFVTPGRTTRVVAEISEALGMTPLEARTS